MTKFTRRALFSSIASIALVASAMSASAENVKLRIAMLFADSMLPTLYAQEKGYFAEAGIDLEPIVIQGGPAAVAALAAGEADVAYSAFIPPINARIGGLPIKLFLTLSHEAAPDFKYTFITASGASGITDLAGTKGKKISFNANGGLCELMWRDHLATVGMTLEDTEVVILPFPEQEKALEQGSIDAVCSVNPFHASIATNANLKSVDLASGILADLTTPVISDGFYATEEWLAANGETAVKLAQVMDKARKELMADRALMEAQSVKHMELTPEAAAMMALPIYKPEMNISAADVQTVLDAMIRNGMQPGPLNGADFVAEIKY